MAVRDTSLSRPGKRRQQGQFGSRRALARSRALWNRSSLDLQDDEQLAQILDRGTMDDWRELYLLAKADPGLRRRLVSVVYRVPLPLPHFWLALLAALGEEVDFSARLPSYVEQGV